MMRDGHRRLQFRKKMLCKTDHICVFLSGIALEKDLPVNLVGVDYCVTGAPLGTHLIAEQCKIILC